MGPWAVLLAAQAVLYGAFAGGYVWGGLALLVYGCCAAPFAAGRVRLLAGQMTADEG